MILGVNDRDQIVNKKLHEETDVTDRQQLQKGCKVILFEYNPNERFNGNQGPAEKSAKDAVKKKFLSKTDVTDDLKANAMKNIHVAHNSNMFKFKLVKKAEN